MEDRKYVFDWDDNILCMRSTIKLEKKDGDEWVPVELSTSQYAIVRDNPKYRTLEGEESFINFRDNKPFIVDTTYAIMNELYGPSFHKFKECILYGNDFAIITARGHDPEVILGGVIRIITITFSDEELSFLKSNINGKYDNLIDYLKNQSYYPVSSPKFNELVGIDTNLHSTEKRKTLALDHYLDNMKSEEDIELDAKFSIGFSDDDRSNVTFMEEHIKNKLLREHPGIHFVIYDTSNPSKINKKVIN